MNQRQSILIPKPTSFPGKEATLYITKYMLENGNVEIPQIFLDLKELTDAVKSSFTSKKTVLKSLTIDPESDIISVISTLTVIALREPVACVIDFGGENIVSIVGYESQFYVIDLFRQVFYATSAPEYEVNTYLESFGSSEDGKFKVDYYTNGGIELENPKPKKKAKTTIKIKE